MATMILDPELAERLKRERQESGGDRYDEVWEGVYVMSLLANDEHQEVVGGLASVFQIVIAWPGLGESRPGVNVSDRSEDWTHNYRCPDIAVFLKNTTARNLDTHWLGGPDFAVEITSRGDRSRDKIPFYAAVDTRELLIVDRFPWKLELYRLEEGALGLVATSTPEESEPLLSAVLPLSFRLQSAEGRRPRIEVAHQDGEQRWTV
ncbi:hypothetical protein BH23PLA1_BH23PLA1_22960 [soil metagenome]